MDPQTPKSTKNETSTCPSAPVKARPEDVNQCKLLRKKVMQRVNAIREYKRRQKALYREYYQAVDALKAQVDHYRNDPIMGFIFEAMLEIDDEDIFYRKKEAKN